MFRKIKASDSQMGGTATGAPVECKTFSDATYGDGRDYHNNWYLLYSGMTGGVNGRKVYRLHTTSTDPTAVNDQKNVDGENSFALLLRPPVGRPGSMASAPCRRSPRSRPAPAAAPRP